MQLVTTDDLRALDIGAGMADADLAAIIDREETELIRRFGAHYVSAVTVTDVLEGGGQSLYLRRAAESITSVTERITLSDTATTVLTTTDYYPWMDQGRLLRLAGRWGALVTVVYVPKDDNALRTQILIELCRLAVTRTALTSESQSDNGASYSYTTQGWEQTRTEQYRRLGFLGV